MSKISVNPNLLAPCGLYCGVCSFRYADKHKDEVLKQKLAKSYGVEPEAIKCDGCLSDNKFAYCKLCPIRDCVITKEIPGCHECSEWPCDKVTNFPFEVAKQFMLKSIPARRERTDEEWVKWEENNWTCGNCGAIAFRGARRCHNCKNEIISILDK